MPRDICIVHIEDEFAQMQPFPSKMRDYVEQYWNDQDGSDSFTTMKRIHTSDEFVVFEIACPRGTGQRIRYIFVGPEVIPEAVKEHMCAHPRFIIDVLRPSKDAQYLFSTAAESIRSAIGFGATLDDITIYTACQGRELQKLREEHDGLKCISKVDIGELNLLISQVVLAGMIDD